MPRLTRRMPEPGPQPGPSALRTLALTQQLAQQRGDPWMSTGHLMVAMAEEEGSPFREALIRRGISPGTLRNALNDLDPPAVRGLLPRRLEFGIRPAPELRAAFGRAAASATAHGRGEIARRDLAVSMLAGGEADTATRLLALLGVPARDLSHDLENSAAAAEAED